MNDVMAGKPCEPVGWEPLPASWLGSAARAGADGKIHCVEMSRASVIQAFEGTGALQSEYDVATRSGAAFEYNPSVSGPNEEHIAGALQL